MSSTPNSEEVGRELPQLLYNAAEVAIMLGICEKTVYRLVARGRLRANKSLRHLKISKSEVARFVQDG